MKIKFTKQSEAYKPQHDRMKTLGKDKQTRVLTVQDFDSEHTFTDWVSETAACSRGATRRTTKHTLKPIQYSQNQSAMFCVNCVFLC